jgi:hypothetical protein
MPSGLKIALAAVIFLMALANMAMIGLRDSIQRPEYCGVCHADPYYSSWEDSDYLAAVHAKAALSCQSCHPRGLGRSAEEIMIEVKGDYRLRRLRVSNDACFRCHAHQSQSELVERTKHANPDPKVNPHVPHHYDEMNCRICHKMHRPSEDFCSECHDPSTSNPGWTIKEKRKGHIPTPGRLPRVN